MTFLLLTKTVYCQLDKGTWLVGGSGSFQSVDRDYIVPPDVVKFKQTDLSITPTIGYFIMDKLVIGLRPSFTWSKLKYVSSIGNLGGGNGNNSWLEIGAFGRWYLLPKDKNYNIVSDGSYQYGLQSNFGKRTGHGNTFKFSIGPELYFNSSVGIELLIGYSSRKELYDDGKSNFYRGFLTTIGFQFHLEK